jgi:hypothetical protein
MSVAAQAGGRHLVQQRLEQVVVGAVDECDVERGITREGSHCPQAAEAAADDDNTLVVHQPSFRRRRTIWMWLRSA